MRLLPDDPRVQRRILALFMPFLILLGYWYLILGPGREGLRETEIALERIGGRNDQLHSRLTALDPISEASLELYEEYLHHLEGLVPLDGELPELLHDLTIRAREDGVELIRLSPLGQRPGSYYTVHEFEVALIGRYHDIGHYLAEVGSLPRIVQSYALELRRIGAPGLPDGPILQAEFKIRTFTIPTAGGSDG